MESLESRGYTVQNQLSKGQFSSILTAYSSLHHSKVAVKLLLVHDVRSSPPVRHGAEWIADLPAEVDVGIALSNVTCELDVAARLVLRDCIRRP